VPGFQNSYPLVVAPYLNARGGRYLDGERRMTMEDLLAERRFDDVLYVYSDRRAEKSCDVPYRALIPRGIDGLLACGRSSLVYGPNFRARCFMLLNGQAAGVAAALCVAGGVEPRELDVRKLQSALVELGCPLGDEERLRELGLK